MERLNSSESKTLSFINLIKETGLSFDVDGVEAWTSEEAVKLYNKRFGRKYSFPKTTSQLNHFYAMNDWLNTIKEKFPESCQDPLQESIKIWNDDNVLANANVEIGVKALLKFLNNHGIVPFRFTSRPADKTKVTYEWFSKNQPDLSADYIYIQRDKNTLNSSFKLEMILDKGVGFHLDDAPMHAEEIAEKGVWVGLVPQPWNESYEPKRGSKIIKPQGYLGRPKIIRAFLSLKDEVINNVAQY